MHQERSKDYILRLVFLGCAAGERWEARWPSIRIMKMFLGAAIIETTVSIAKLTAETKCSVEVTVVHATLFEILRPSCCWELVQAILQ